jgi:hypothetical protein
MENANIEKEVALVKPQISMIVKAAIALKIKVVEDMTEATNLLSEIKIVKKGVKEKRRRLPNRQI